MTNVNEFRHIVEGCRRVDHEGPFIWKPVATFKHKGDAENFILMQRRIISEAVSSDQVEVRLRPSNDKR
jgi:hypothetical protein